MPGGNAFIGETAGQQPDLWIPLRMYGVLSYSIARRTGEIAMRIALGAQPGRVITGLAAGAGLAYAASGSDGRAAPGMKLSV